MGNVAPGMKRAKCVNCMFELAACRLKNGESDVWKDAAGTYDATYFAELDGDHKPDPTLEQHLTVTWRNKSGSWTHQYKACEHCITDDTRSAFEYRPNGYDEPRMK